MTDDILGWSSGQWQAAGTIVLVLVTIAYVINTATLARQAKSSASSAMKSAQAAERAATSAERSLLLQTMPLVFGHKVQTVDSGMTEVTLFAVGQPPALRLEVVVRQDGREGHAGPFSFHDPAIGSRRIDLSAEFELVDPDPYEVLVSYYDALGNRYRTRRMSLLRGQSETHVDRYDEKADLWVPLV